MAICILKPDATGKRKLVPLSPQRAARFKAILDGKAIPTPLEKEKAALIAKIYLSREYVSPYSESVTHAYPIAIRKPYKD